MGHSFHNRPYVAPRGFTLIEMLIVLTIIIIVTGVAIAGQQNFDRTLTLNNTAYSLALTLREAQTFGFSSRALNNVQNAGYGVSIVNDASNPIVSYTFFGDTCTPVAATAKPDERPGDGYYDALSPIPKCSGAALSAERISTVTWNNGFAIQKFCAKPSGATLPSQWHCSNYTGSYLIQNMDIVFRRPESSARISAYRAGASYDEGYTRACYSIIGTSGDTRTVLVTENGQISVSNSTCPTP